MFSWPAACGDLAGDRLGLVLGVAAERVGVLRGELLAAGLLRRAGRAANACSVVSDCAGLLRLLRRRPSRSCGWTLS